MLIPSSSPHLSESHSSVLLPTLPLLNASLLFAERLSGSNSETLAKTCTLGFGIGKLIPEAKSVLCVTYMFCCNSKVSLRQKYTHTYVVSL